MGLEPFAWWCLNYVIIPFATGGIVVFLVHQLLLFYWDLRDQGLVRRRRRELYERLHGDLQERLRAQPPGQRLRPTDTPPEEPPPEGGAAP